MKIQQFSTKINRQKGKTKEEKESYPIILTDLESNCTEKTTRRIWKLEEEEAQMVRRLIQIHGSMKSRDGFSVFALLSLSTLYIDDDVN